MDLSTALALVAALCLWAWWLQRDRRWRTLPPGPPALPIVGNLLELKRQERWEHKFIEWAHAYGPVYTYWLGPHPVVSIHSYPLAHKYFVAEGETFAGRMSRPQLCRIVRGGCLGLIDNHGAAWREQRRFALRTLRDFGVGKNRMEARIAAEVETMCRRIDCALDVDHPGELDCERYTDIAAGSVINAILCGYRFTEDGNEDEFYRLKALTTKAIQLAVSEWPNLVLNNLWLLNVPLVGRPGRETIATFRLILDHLQKCIDRHRAANDDYECEFAPNDFIDAYFLEMRRQRAAQAPNANFSEDQLRNVCFDLWIAGQETSSTSMTWIIAYMVRYPAVQAKLQEELDRVLGSSRPTMADRVHLPFTQAVIMEVQRCSNVTGQNIPHTTTRDTFVEGYFLPKGTIVVPQISVMMMDENVFADPGAFRPERFVGAGGLLAPPQHLPFSLGRRRCVGEALARMELFLFTASLLQRYRFSEGRAPPTLRKIGGNATVTEPFTCRVHRRC